MFGQSPATRPKFDAASVKPAQDTRFMGVVPLPGGRLSGNISIAAAIANAYGVKPFQVLGGPGWINSDRYQIEARAEGSPSPSQVWLMLQTLLEDRFKLALHREMRELPVYELSVTKGGLKKQSATEGNCVSSDPNAAPLPPAPGQPMRCGSILMMMSPSGGRMQGDKVSVPALVANLSNLVGRAVIDRTGLTGTLDVHLEFSRDEALAGVPAPAPPGGDPRPVSSDPNFPSIFVAIQEQLGLKLESAKGPVEVLIVDRVERPSEN
jgi:uncharacterized protein (TIGR03435 family)